MTELMHRIYDRGLSRTEIAAFAPQVVELAEKGDAASLDILDRGAALLAEITAANHRKLPTSPEPEMVITGGLGTAPTIYRKKIESAIRAGVPGVRLREALLSPVMGAALLALTQAGRPVTDGLVQGLKGLSK